MRLWLASRAETIAPADTGQSVKCRVVRQCWFPGDRRAEDRIKKNEDVEETQGQNHEEENGQGGDDGCERGACGEAGQPREQPAPPQPINLLLC